MRSSLLFIVVVLLPHGMAFGTNGANGTGQRLPLRLADPIEDVIADLAGYIPQRMREDGIPGLSIALIRDGRIVWTEGYGVANSLSARPVTMDTTYEVASISKAVTAYMALRLVGRGVLSLDGPLSSHLGEPWLPPSEYGDKITLRHLASHSSGLPDNAGTFLTIDKSIAFQPGTAFLYSAVAYMYMQDAVEQVTGRSLEDNARELVFEPLGMSRSSFSGGLAVRPHQANGHIDYIVPLLLFVIPFATILIGVALVGSAILRVVAGHWQPTWRMSLAACVSVGIVTIVMFAGSPLGEGVPGLVVLTGVCGSAFVATLVVVAYVSNRISARYLQAWHGRVSLRLLAVSYGVLSIVLLLSLAALIPGPIPRDPPPGPSAIGSLRASAPDLATFLLELAHPRHMSEELAAQIGTRQVAISADMSWGFGIGIHHGEQGTALWHNGQTPGFRSLMVIYPQYGTGVVVLSNSDHGFAVVSDVAQRALGGSTTLSINAFLL